jgi:hypothetical protein
MKRVPLSLVSTIEELLEKNSSDSGLENGHKGSVVLPMQHFLYTKVGTNFADKRRSLSRNSYLSRNEATEFVCLS